jgi:cytochrome c-type biogenesis protein
VLLPLAADTVNATVFVAFAAGFLSFVSPCVLPLVPGYLSAVSGISVAEVRTGERSRVDVLWPAIQFCLGFTIVFVALGMFATGLGAPLADNRELLNRIAGALLILMGVLFLVIPRVPALNRELRPDGLLHKAVAVGPVLAGGAFAFGWTPCTGPILGAILNAAATKDSVAGGAFLLTFYSLGLAVPFLLTALAVNRATDAFRWIRSHYGAIMTVSGVILIVVGVLVATDQMTRLNTEARAFLDSVGLQGLVDAIEM